ncbi:MAG TPA: nuclear transport factor 2 family protein [Cyclobacteriaceae bacterium]
MKNFAFCAVIAAHLISCNQSTEQASDSENISMPMPLELASPMYRDVAKKCLMDLTEKNVDAFIEKFSDNAVYRFNNLDSLSGKELIRAYWEDRMTNVIERLEINDDVWLPIKVNQSENVRTGDWVLNWSRVKATYANGKSMTQLVHTVYHFDTEGKIDQVTQFVDQAPIMSALSENY